MEQKRLQKQSNKGITLIALIITVIVMLILAGVAINMTIGDNGIFKKTAETVVIHENAEVYEQLCLKIVDDELGDRIENTKTDKLSKLKSDGYMDENGIVNVEAVTKRKMKTGNGNLEIGDLYGIVSIENEYYLIYLDKNKKEKVLGKLFEISEDELLEPTPEDYFEFDPETGGIALKANIGYYITAGEVSEVGLKTIVIPSTYQGQPVTKIGVAGVCEKAGSHARNIIYGINATDVEKIVIPKSITEIGDTAFIGCSNLQEITIPNSVIKMGDRVFAECTSLQNITIPDSVTEIGYAAFNNCEMLQKVKLSNSVKTIGNGTFANCSNLRQLAIPNSVIKMGDRVFAECTSLQNITIPDSVTAIGYWAFANCSNLRQLTIPNSVTTIDSGAFIKCGNLREITIPESVVKMGVRVFGYWTNTQKIYVPFKEGENPEGWYKGSESDWNGGSAQIIYQY